MAFKNTEYCDHCDKAMDGPGIRYHIILHEGIDYADSPDDYLNVRIVDEKLNTTRIRPPVGYNDMSFCRLSCYEAYMREDMEMHLKHAKEIWNRGLKDA